MEKYAHKWTEEHKTNQTGTPDAYAPPGYLLSGGAKPLNRGRWTGPKGKYVDPLDQD
jgi:hypothetical protein